MEEMDGRETRRWLFYGVQEYDATIAYTNQEGAQKFGRGAVKRKDKVNNMVKLQATTVMIMLPINDDSN